MLRPFEEMTRVSTGQAHMAETDQVKHPIRLGRPSEVGIEMAKRAARSGPARAR